MEFQRVLIKSYKHIEYWYQPFVGMVVDIISDKPSNHNYYSLANNYFNLSQFGQYSVKRSPKICLICADDITVCNSNEDFLTSLTPIEDGI